MPWERLIKRQSDGSDNTPRIPNWFSRGIYLWQTLLLSFSTREVVRIAKGCQCYDFLDKKLWQTLILPFSAREVVRIAKDG